MGRLVQRSAVRAFEIFGLLAVLLNVFAAAVAIKRDLWSMALAYFLIAAMLAGALAVHWYVQHRQVPYRWRDEEWGLERWREESRGDDLDDDGWGEYDWPDDTGPSRRD